MKTYTLIFALSFIGSVAFGQAQVSTVGTLGGNAGSGAAAASYAATGKAIAPSDTTKKAVSPTTSLARLSTNMTVARQTQGATFGEKVNQGLHAAGSAVASGAVKVASPGNPIGGIIVKGGKNE
jgi:hypothetical protein